MSGSRIGRFAFSDAAGGLITAIGVSYLLQKSFIFGAVFALVCCLKLGRAADDHRRNDGDDRRLGDYYGWAEPFIKKTKAGRAVVSEDKGAAQLMGVNVPHDCADFCRVRWRRSRAFCSARPADASPYTGAMPGIKAFVAAVFRYRIDRSAEFSGRYREFE